MRRNYIFTAITTAALSLIILWGLLGFAYRADNQYTAPQPIGQGGEIRLSDRDLSRPLFLIDGWMLSVDGGVSAETFIGQYSNFSFAPGGTSPFGTAEYRLTLRYDGAPRVLTLGLPEIFTDYTLYVNGTALASRGSGTQVSFMADATTELRLITENHTHYYSGLYHPIALGTTEVIGHMTFLRTLFYAIICVSALTLALFSLILWARREREPLFLHFGLLCLCFVISCLHPFVWQLGLSTPLWYAAEDTSRLLVWVEAAAIAAVVTGLWRHRTVRKRIYPTMLTIVGVSFLIIVFIIPILPNIVNHYGTMLDVFTILCWLWLAVCTGIGLTKSVGAPQLFTLSGCCILGASLFSNLLDNNHFEPIYTGWQGEWAGFLLVLVFGGLMIWRNAMILQENRTLALHLEEQVQERTRQLSAVLEERKRFFSDMAHNLKAPIAAIHGFITLIRDGSVGVDDELLGYLSLIETENLEMRRRVQSLNTLNAFDRIDEEKTVISVDEFLAEVEICNAPEANAIGVHLTIGRLNTPATVCVHREKLLTLFENLIYNALSFTPMEGAIRIMPSIAHGNVVIAVSDTGCGIPPEHLPHIFERFYVGRKNKNEGSGLGLYIAKLTVEELGGSIAATSVVGQGTTLTLTIPLCP